MKKLRPFTMTTPRFGSGLLALTLIGALAVEPHTVLDDLRQAVPVRTIAPRLSVGADYSPCTNSIGIEASIPRTRCPATVESRTQFGQTIEAWKGVRRALRSGDTTAALHALGLLQLLESNRSGNSLNKAISTLQDAARRTNHSAAILADLSAAYLVRAQETQNARDLLEAMTTAHQSLELEPTSSAARFDLALALDWFGLDDQAGEAWRAYLGVDPSSGWAEEARNRLRSLSRKSRLPPPPTSASPADAIDSFVSSAPQQARLYGLDRVLGEWGAAVLKGDGARTAERLRLAQELGESLVRRSGDATLADAVRAVRAAGPSAYTMLARAHVEYSAGQSAYFAVDYSTAGAHFARVLELRPPSRALTDWARVFDAAMRVQKGEFPTAERAMEAVAAGTDTVRYPALAGRSRWVLATALLRDGRYEAALNAAQDAARLLGRAGEREHQGGAEYVAADAQFYLGATVAAHEAAHRALGTLRGERTSVWLLNALAVAARVAEADGLAMAAVRIQDERVALAERMGLPVRIAEARLGRARLLAAGRMRDRGRSDIEASERLVQTLYGVAKTWLETELRFARAALLGRTEPRRALAAFDSVLATTGGSLTAPRRMRARVGRAEVRLALGEIAGATADLDTASVILAEERDSIGRTEFRASLLDAARGVFDRLAMLRVAAGDTVGALRFLERGRVSFGPTARGAAESPEAKPRMLTGEVAVEYALVEDTLLVWTVADTTVRLIRRTVDRTALTHSVEDARMALERGIDDRPLHRSLAELYDLLVRPLQPQLGGDGRTLVLIADGELAALPFSALYDEHSGHYLMQSHALRYAGSLRDANRTRLRGPAAARALLVADPAFDPAANPGLERLRGARAEVGSIAASYSHPLVLADSAAMPSAVEADLPRAAVVHFAGHAVLDDQRPERSYLVLAPGRGRTGAAWLTAAQLEKLPLQNVDLVVLSACETLRSHSGRSGGFAGFTGALLDAGAGGVVGSLWRVDDRLTAPLMVGFHHAYRRSHDGPGALREAQLEMLQSSDPALRSPAAWAGFRYAGN